MPQSEYEAWIEFYRLYPFDDYHIHYRPAALVCTAFGGGEVQPRLDWLQPDRASEGTADDDADLLRAFGIDVKGE